MLLYDKTEYQWLMDWYFFQRTEDDFRRILVEAGYNLDQIETTRDAVGVIINFLYRDKAPAAVRIDKAGAAGTSAAGEHAGCLAGFAIINSIRVNCGAGTTTIPAVIEEKGV